MAPTDKQSENPSYHEDETTLRQEAIAWVVRLNNSRISPEDQQAFETWKAKSTIHLQVFQKVSAIWGDPDLHAAATQRAQEPSSILPQQSATPRRWLQHAGAIAACAMLFTMAIVHYDPLTWLQADYRTAIGEQRTIALPDGSTVVLNTQTAIATSFDQTARRIRLLKGEASFNVQPDSHRPFVVESQQTATRAVGTEFMVRTQQDQELVTVLEGTVEVSSLHDQNLPALVSAGSRVQFEHGRLGRPFSVDLATVSAWLNGRLIVNGVPLEQVIDEVRRYYPGTILLLNQPIRDMQVTGTYNLEDPSKSLSLLAKTFPTHMFNLANRFVILF
ncbi:FecR family protein [Nitrospira sp. Ecomares 2.1]